jgi:hypothetical protein
VRPATRQGEGLAVWSLLAADVLAVLVVYSVLEPGELYNVSRDGLEGGLGRALVQLNFPIALVAVPLSLLALDALPRRAWLAGAPAIALSVVVAWPGVVDPDDLDARAVNGLPAVGVVLALALTVAAARRAGCGFASSSPGDRVRIVAAVVVVLVSLPWFAAEAGWDLPGAWAFLTDDLYAEPGRPPTAAVHLGHHHGFAGTLLVLSALLLSRPRLTGRRLRLAYGALVSLQLAYGLVNLVEDGWHEQVVKRGWTEWDLPSALVPGPNAIWLVVLAGATVAFGLGFARHDPVPTRDNPV